MHSADPYTLAHIIRELSVIRQSFPSSEPETGKNFVNGRRDRYYEKKVSSPASKTVVKTDQIFPPLATEKKSTHKLKATNVSG
ncbi:hypothetical protein [Pedobacter psychrodurus]|uniref:hypothetical protein n=1 Tax=Pedobacter psychrodurus TaxID=2530456 RepID=UPI0029308244|nr:hypothetical protein [Pedobacter psychrodurus]